MIQRVTVVNKFAVFNATVRDNRFMNQHPVMVYDNTRENIGIARRYNDFIQNHLPDDAWIVFCHQDFAFNEDIAEKLDALDNAFIYGPIGAGPITQLVFIAAFSRYRTERFRIGFYQRTKEFGQIIQKTSEKTVRMGQLIRKPVVVDTVDCCCMIVHSSLIRSNNLTFDDKLDWHLYVEDFCLNARRKHNVVAKAVQLSCTHFSSGNLNSAFQDDLHYVKKKYDASAFSTTCYDGYARF